MDCLAEIRGYCNIKLLRHCTLAAQLCVLHSFEAEKPSSQRQGLCSLGPRVPRQHRLVRDKLDDQAQCCCGVHPPGAASDCHNSVVGKIYLLTII